MGVFISACLYQMPQFPYYCPVLFRHAGHGFVIADWFSENICDFCEVPDEFIIAGMISKLMEERALWWTPERSMFISDHSRQFKQLSVILSLVKTVDFRGIDSVIGIVCHSLHFSYLVTRIQYIFFSNL